MRAILLLVTTLMVLAEPAAAQTVTQIDTELVKGRCRFIADDGEVGHYALKRCPGLAGARVYTTADVHDVALSFRWGRAKPVEVLSNNSIGTKLEWRGIKSKTGFTPHAVLVQIIVKDFEDDQKPHNVWGIIRMEKRNACLMAVVDEEANKEALAMARSVADAEAPRLACANLKPKIVGVETRWAKEAAGLAEPPK